MGAGAPSVLPGSAQPPAVGTGGPGGTGGTGIMAGVPGADVPAPEPKAYLRANYKPSSWRGTIANALRNIGVSPDVGPYSDFYEEWTAPAMIAGLASGVPEGAPLEEFMTKRARGAPISQTREQMLGAFQEMVDTIMEAAQRKTGQEDVRLNNPLATFLQGVNLKGSAGAADIGNLIAMMATGNQGDRAGTAPGSAAPLSSLYERRWRRALESGEVGLGTNPFRFLAPFLITPEQQAVLDEVSRTRRNAR